MFFVDNKSQFQSLIFLQKKSSENSFLFMQKKLIFRTPEIWFMSI